MYSILLARTGVRNKSTVACGFSPITIQYFDYQNRSISRINKIYDFSIKYAKAIFFEEKFKFKFHHLFCCKHTCYCVCMVSVTSAARYQSRFLIYIRGLIPLNLPRQFRLSIDRGSSRPLETYRCLSM